MDIASLLKEKREEILQIAGRYGARNVRVFGSVARGDAGPKSDIDFLVQFEPGVTLLDHAAFVRELEALLGRKVEVVSERGLRPRIRDEVLREAAPI
jgi:predicted nucleotidyltransferase